MIAVTALTGYLIGSMPSAQTLGRVWGVSLRSDGSGNPGANNALRLGGPVLALTVLLIEIAKGLASVMTGMGMAGESGAVIAGLAAVAGNVYNVWYRFEGGKGLGISSGVLIGLWPLVLVPVLVLLAATSLITSSSGAGTLIAMTGLNVAAVAWWASGWDTGWGVDAGPLLLVVSAGITIILWERHHREASFRRQAVN